MCDLLAAPMPLRRAAALAACWAALSSAGCTTAPPRVVTLPPLEPVRIPAPAECTAAAISAYPRQLGALPGAYAQTPAGVAGDAERARILLAIKAADALLYQHLRAQALRCAENPQGGSQRR